MKKIALVTGASSGIGKEISRRLIQNGFVVFLGSRSLNRAREAALEIEDTGRAIPLQVDVTVDQSIRAALSVIANAYGRLDVLVNNAGINAGREDPSDVPVESMRITFETNVFAVVALTNAALPLLRRSAAGRIVNMSSHRASLSSDRAFVGRRSMPYSVSKTALNALTVHYAQELLATGIKVNAAAPGHCATALNGFTGSRTPAEGADIAVQLAILDHSGPTGQFFDDEGVLSW